MTSTCPDCGKSIDTRDMRKHLEAHDRATRTVDEAIARVAKMSDAEVESFLARERARMRRRTK